MPEFSNFWEANERAYVQLLHTDLMRTDELQRCLAEAESLPKPPRQIFHRASNLKLSKELPVQHLFPPHPLSPSLHPGLVQGSRFASSATSSIRGRNFLMVRLGRGVGTDVTLPSGDPAGGEGRASRLMKI